MRKTKAPSPPKAERAGERGNPHTDRHTPLPHPLPARGEREPRRPVAVVTGASRGIGRSIAHELALAGCDVVITSTTRGGTREVAADLRRIPRATIVEAVYDARSRPSADALVKLTLRALGTPEILVNNAGIVIRKPLLETTDDDFDRVLAVNLSGPFALCRRFLPHMAKRGGTIINLSSISATLGNAQAVGYCASKWGLDGLTKSLAADFATTGVRVVSVLPGSVDTDMLKGSGFAPQLKPVDVAKVVRFLALEAPDAINGTRVELFE